MNPAYVIRFKQMREGYKLLLEDDGFAAATALLAVHACIALNDAVLSSWLGRIVSGKDHMQAVRETKSVCKQRKLDDSGVRHLEALLSDKNEVSYSDRVISPAKAQKLAITAERFEAWAFKTCKELEQWERLTSQPGDSVQSPSTDGSSTL